MKKIRYENLDKKATLNTFRDLLAWQKERRGKKKDLSFQVPYIKNPDVSFLQSNRTETTITWIGHSTFLIQMNGKNFLTDPVWAKRLGFARRLSPPGLPLDSLPAIDFVLISHSHYDHLHYSTIKRLKGSTFFVPIGLGHWFTRKGFKKVVECKWWDEQIFASINVRFVPAQHWTKRTMTDTNRSHWGGWVVTGEKTIHFVGDSGYFKGFTEIGKRHNIDYCLMPIGAYEPEWFMATSHVSPEDAVQAFIDTGATTMIPMHYGAYMLADDTPKEALDRLKAEWDKRKLNHDRLKILKVGETIIL